MEYIKPKFCENPSKRVTQIKSKDSSEEKKTKKTGAEFVSSTQVHGKTTDK